MATMVTIGEETVDFDDPCAVAGALRRVELSIVAGGGVVRARFGSDDVQFSSGNLTHLRDLIGRYERACALVDGRRSRFAKRIRFT